MGAGDLNARNEYEAGILMRADIIYKHEDWQQDKLSVFLAHLARSLGNPVPPAEDKVSGVVQAYINHGRWVADCPDCAGGIVVSMHTPLYYCPCCGNQSNEGLWYQVIYPPEMAAIEMELLKRPARDGFRAVNRNWDVGESIQQLRTENTDRGIQ